MKARGIDPGKLKLEITEDALFSRKADLTQYLQSLRKAGYRISLDDFGSGYSSLANLQTLPVDEIKIDKSFVQAIQSADDSTAMVDAIISVANHLQFAVVAEGVETEVQANMLHQKQVDGVQGFYYAEPMSEDRFHQLMSQYRVQHSSPVI